MVTPMRWADSDSDDSDDGYNVNEESTEASKAEEAPVSTYNEQYQANGPQTLPSRDNYKSKYANENKGQRKHQQHTHHTKNHQKGGNGGNYGGGSKNRSQHNNNKNRGGGGPENWKQMAKASSRFSSGTWLNYLLLFRLF